MDSDYSLSESINFFTIFLDLVSIQFKKFPEEKPTKNDKNIVKSIIEELNSGVVDEREINPAFNPITNNIENEDEKIGLNKKYIKVPKFLVVSLLLIFIKSLIINLYNFLI